MDETQPATPERDETAELQQSYSEASVRASRFLVSTLIILIVLGIIVEQELREYQKADRRLEGEKADASKALNDAREELQETVSEVQDFRRDKPEAARLPELATDRWPKLTTRIEGAEDVKELQTKEGEFVENVLKKLEASSSLERKGNEQQEKGRAGQGKQPPARGEPSTSPPTNNERSAAKRPAKQFIAPGAVARAATAPVQPSEGRQFALDRAVHLAEKYKAAYHKGVVAAEKVLTTSGEREKLKSSKKSVPTPFGQFDVLPKLALFALAFASLLSYISFHLSLIRIRGLAKNYYRLSGGRKVSSAVGAPPWLYSKDPELDEVLTWHHSRRLRLLLSFAVHAFWLTLAGWLVWDSLMKWDAGEEFLFDYKQFWIYMMVVCFAISLGLAAWQFVPPRLRRALSHVRERGRAVPLNADRRTFLRVGIPAFLLVALGGVVYFVRTRRFSEPKKFELIGAEFEANLAGADLVANNKTRIIHQATVCKDHLPAQKNRVDLRTSQEKFRVHVGNEARIWEGLATSTLRDDKSNVQEIERAIAYLQKAIELSPFSHHLYDRLIGAYGRRRIRQHDKIMPLLQGALQRAEKKAEELTQAAAASPDPKKSKRLEREMKQLRRAQDKFRLRMKQVEQRKSKAGASIRRAG